MLKSKISLSIFTPVALISKLILKKISAEIPFGILESVILISAFK